jgi:hypothetical protein
MIAHIVIFEPKTGLTPPQTRAVLEALQIEAARIPAVRSFAVGRRVRHGLPGYEQSMRSDFEYAAIVQFDDMAGLKAYLQHPAHAAIARYFADSAAAALVYDYQLVDIAEADALVE